LEFHPIEVWHPVFFHSGKRLWLLAMPSTTQDAIRVKLPKNWNQRGQHDPLANT